MASLFSSHSNLNHSHSTSNLSRSNSTSNHNHNSSINNRIPITSSHITSHRVVVMVRRYSLVCLQHY